MERNLYAGQEAAVRTGHETTELVPNQERSRSNPGLMQSMGLQRVGRN